MINFGNIPQRSGDWTWFKPLISSKSLRVQYEDNGDVYLIYGYDMPEVITCTIWKGTVPESVVGGGYSQAQNDADKSDFETNYLPTANKPIIQSVGSTGLQTYAAEVALAGANNKDMLSIVNPAGSGKVLKLRKVWGVVPSSSGASVIISFELRGTTEVTTGTIISAKKMDSVNADAVAVVRSAPTGITDSDAPVVYWTWIQQINTAQGGTENMSHTLHNSSAVADIQPITLRPGEGLYLEQKANNTSTFRMGVLWTEE